MRIKYEPSNIKTSKGKAGRRVRERIVFGVPTQSYVFVRIRKCPRNNTLFVPGRGRSRLIVHAEVQLLFLPFSVTTCA